MPRDPRRPVELPPGPGRDLVDLFRRLARVNRLDNVTIAQKARLSRSYVGELLNGRKVPTSETAARLAVALGASRTEQLAAVGLSERSIELHRYERTKAPVQVAVPGIDRWNIVMKFTLALDSAHHALRRVAASDTDTDVDRLAHADGAVHRSGVYAEREQVLAVASPELAAKGEATFLALVSVRDTIRAGSGLDSGGYHRAYHHFAEALWGFRLAVRAEFGQQPLTPALLGRADWSDLGDCGHCRDAPTSTPSPGSPWFTGEPPTETAVAGTSTDHAVAPLFGASSRENTRTAP